MREQHQWAAILAGGEGRRLQSITRSIAGDARPKQFCRIFGTGTLLDETRARLLHNVEADRTLYVVTRAHEPFYREGLADVEAWRVIQQPGNRGTSAAVAATITRLRRMGAAGTVGLFPADHYYRDDAALRRTVAAAYAVAAAKPGGIILVGAKATRPETEYGWIEPGRPLNGGSAHAAGAAAIHDVASFCEKPSAAAAEGLLARGCLWNTMIVVGQIGAFESLLAEAVPDVWREFASRSRADTGSDAALRAAYAAIRPSDFSHEVLATCPHRLSVIELTGGGWTDLGQPHRVLDVLAERHQVLPSSRLAAG
jgi:mannose-1-phosphate guanylyltransferase